MTRSQKRKQKAEKRKWNSIHKPLPSKPPELDLGAEYLCQIAPDTFIEGVVISVGNTFILRLNKPEPNLIYIKKGFVNKNEIKRL